MDLCGNLATGISGTHVFNKEGCLLEVLEVKFDGHAHDPVLVSSGLGR